jgi:3-(3-hydroxy-phenyl)propionate hydroxylase
MFMPIGRLRQRFEFAVHDDEPRDLVESPAFAWTLLREHHDVGPEDVRIIRQLEYTFESRIAQRWRAGRVFLAGDAAHTMPPYLGQGACSGMRDSTNLAWKLDLVLSGRSSVELLDCYEPERRPQLTFMTQLSMGLGSIANLADPVAAEQRDAAFRSGPAPPPPQFPGVCAGVVRLAADGSVAGPAGTLTPQGRVAIHGRTGRFDDVIGGSFWLLARSVPDELLGPERLAFLEQLGCAVLELGSFGDLDGRCTAYLDELEADAVLVRPDFYLFGVATTDADVPGLVDDLREALHWVGAPSVTAA